jgi:hypothetical protein
LPKTESTPSRPADLWRQFPSVVRDIERAERLLADGQLLPGTLWAALVWKWTSVPTAPCYWSSHEHAWMLAASGTRNHTTEAVVGYYPVSKLADGAHVWATQAPPGAMRDWIALLRDEADWRGATNYLARSYEANIAGDPPTSGMDRAAIKAHIARLGNPERTPRPPDQPLLPALRVDVPNRDLVAAELAANQGALPVPLSPAEQKREGKPDAVGTFFEEKP